MSRIQTLGVKHNIEVAHRLYELPGKCEQIHGHSMWITLGIDGELDEHGLLEGIEFGLLKTAFRGYLDGNYDHRVLLNENDPFASELQTVDREADKITSGLMLPGVRACPGDPTTEHIANWVLNDIDQILSSMMDGRTYSGLEVTVWETAVNFAKVKETY
jgi:6-pyruvoyltetrahydropterin/6-carboxytetrahydropterin synthase